jgi:hypothetical protein
MYKVVGMHDTRQGQYSENMESSSKIFWSSLRIIQLLVSILVLGLAANGTPFFDNSDITN